MSAHANPTNNLELPPVTASEEVRDRCRESQLTPGEAHDEYLKLNGQITAHLDAFVGKIVDATEEFKNSILPLLDQMQSMLSKRGRLRKLLNIAGVQIWEEWFEDFEKRLHLDISFRTIQRWLKEYRLEKGEVPPAPNVNVLATESLRHIESPRQAEKLESVVKGLRQINPANRAKLIRALKARVKKDLVLIAKLEKGFTPLPVAFRYIKPEDKYPYLTGELAKKLGISPHKVVAFVKMFQMKGNDEYHTSIKVSSTGKVQRYSEKAHQVLATALSKEGADKLLSQANQGKTLDPKAYTPEPKPAAALPIQERSA